MNDLLQTIITTIKKILEQFTQPVAPTAKTNTSPTITPQPTVAPQVKAEAAPIKVEETLKPIVVPETTSAIEAVTTPTTVEVVQPIAVSTSPAKSVTDNLPEDSIQRRHAITELQNRVEALYGATPSDSILKRHFSSHIDNVITQSLTNKELLDLLNEQYESLKTCATATASPVLETVTPEATKTVTATKTTDNSYIPTDSILKRHYDTMVNNELNSLLEDGQ